MRARSSSLTLGLAFLVTACSVAPQGTVVPSEPRLQPVAVPTEPGLGAEAATPPIAESTVREEVPLAADAATSGQDVGPWFVAENGAEYRLEPFPKATPHVRLEGKFVRLAFGLTIEVEEEDEQFFYTRYYRAQASPPGADAKAIEVLQREILDALPAAPPSVDLLMGFDLARGLPNEGQWRNGFEFADMNEDGLLDLVHGPSRKGTARPNIFLGDGAGGWTRWAARYPVANYDYGDVSVGDFDGDGHRDLVLGVHLRGLLALLGDGKGDFRLASEGLPMRTSSQEPMGFSSRQVQAVDFDGDGRDEILAYGEGPKMATTAGRAKFDDGAYGVVVYRATKTSGGIAWSPLVSEGIDSFGDDLRLLPRARHQKGPSFVVGSSRMSDSQLLFRGLETERWVRDSLPVRPFSYVYSITALGNDPTRLAAAYFSAQGGLRFSGVDFYEKGDEGWRLVPLIAEVRKLRNFVRVASADLDGNRLPDLVTLTADGQVRVFLQTAKDRWSEEASPELQAPQGCSGFGLQLQDVTGDGRPEIAYSFAGESNAMFAPDACRSSGTLRVWGLLKKAGTER